MAGGKTFFWRGHYDYDLNIAHTDDTQLNVFGDFQPKLSEESKAVGDASSSPTSSRTCSSRCASSASAATLVGLDSMNLWIDTARDSLVRAIGAVDLVLMNDAELRMLTEQPNLVRAARDVMAMGPRMVVAKQGEYGAALFTEDSFFALPGYPLEEVRRPDRRGGQLRRRLPRLPRRDRPRRASTTRRCGGR